MLTSTEEAQNCVNYMRSRNPLNPSVLIGHYRLHDNYVNLYLKKQETKTNNDNRKKRKGEIFHDSGEQTFHIVSTLFSVFRLKFMERSFIIFLLLF